MVDDSFLSLTKKEVISALNIDDRLKNVFIEVMKKIQSYFNENGDSIQINYKDYLEKYLIGNSSLDRESILKSEKFINFFNERKESYKKLLSLIDLKDEENISIDEIFQEFALNEGFNAGISILVDDLHLSCGIYMPKTNIIYIDKESLSSDNLNHVLAISDVVVTDYSTIVYDCAIAGKPFICFGFDYERYKKERGFYYDLADVYPGGVFHTEDEVMDRIDAVMNGVDVEKYKAFREKYIEAGGNATDAVITAIKQRLNGEGVL